LALFASLPSCGLIKPGEMRVFDAAQGLGVRCGPKARLQASASAVGLDPIASVRSRKARPPALLASSLARWNAQKPTHADSN